MPARGAAAASTGLRGVGLLGAASPLLPANKCWEWNQRQEHAVAAVGTRPLPHLQVHWDLEVDAAAAKQLHTPAQLPPHAAAVPQILRGKRVGGGGDLCRSAGALLPQGPRKEVARGGCAAAGVVCQRMSAEACAALNVISPAPLRMQPGAGRQPRQGRTQQRAGAGCRLRRQARRRLCGGATSLRPAR